MALLTNGRPQLVDLSRVASDARPVLDWFEWYADTERQALDPDAVADLVTALDRLVPYTEISGPVGDAACVLVAGGLGHPTTAHLDALDTFDQIANPSRDEPAPWHQNRRPRTDLDIPDPHYSEVGSGKAIPLQLPGVIWPEPSPKRRST
jgi:hypothetical protein